MTILSAAIVFGTFVTPLSSTGLPAPYPSSPPPSPTPTPSCGSTAHLAALCSTAPGIGLVIGGAITYALSEGSFLPASCDGSRGREVSPEERDEEAERLAGPTPSDGSDER